MADNYDNNNIDNNIPIDADGNPITDDSAVAVLRPSQTVTVVIDDEIDQVHTPAPTTTRTIMLGLGHMHRQPQWQQQPQSDYPFPRSDDDEALMRLDVSNLPVAQAEPIAVVLPEHRVDGGGGDCHHVPFVPATTISQLHQNFVIDDSNMPTSSTMNVLSTPPGPSPRSTPSSTLVAVEVVADPEQPPATVNITSGPPTATTAMPTMMIHSNNQRQHQLRRSGRRKCLRDEDGSLNCCAITLIVTSSIFCCVLITVLSLGFLWQLSQTDPEAFGGSSGDNNKTNTFCGGIWTPCLDDQDNTKNNVTSSVTTNTTATNPNNSTG